MNFFKRMFEANRTHDPDRKDGFDETKDWRIVDVDPGTPNYMVFRLRIVRPLLPPGRKFDTGVWLEWPYGEGMIDRDLNLRLQEVESHFDHLTAANGFAELVCVATGQGSKNWHFYTSDLQRLVSELERALPPEDFIPFKITARDDPEWAEWSSLVADIEVRNPDDAR